MDEIPIVTQADEAFANAVWDALKGDHSDLRKQAIILEAHRIASNTEAATLLAEMAEAQRDALATAYHIGEMGYLTTFASGRSAAALFRRGLTHLSWAPSGLTDLGLAVRNHIKDTTP